MSWGRLPWGLRERPFDVYAATLLISIGIYVLTYDITPERLNNTVVSIIVNVVALYLITASSVILAALLKNPRKCPAFVLFGEMYGWAFVTAAALATSIMYLASLLWYTPTSWLLWGIWFFLWFMLTIAAGVRSFDLIKKYQGIRS